MYNCLFFARKQSDIEKLLTSFDVDGYKYNWEIRREVSIQEYLGIYIQNLFKNISKLTQTVLIIKVIKEVIMDDCNGKPTPTNIEVPLGPNPNGKPSR